MRFPVPDPLRNRASLRHGTDRSLQGAVPQKQQQQHTAAVEHESRSPKSTGRKTRTPIQSASETGTNAEAIRDRGE